jgi:hypothetical protein
MVTREVIVKSSTGLHARPATLLVKKASSFKSDIISPFSQLNLLNLFYIYNKDLDRWQALNFYFHYLLICHL